MIEIGLAVAYVFVAVLVLNLWTATQWRMAVKIAVVLLTSLLYVGTYVGIKELRGWPTDEPLPESFFFVWAKIDEPDKRIGSKGQIYLWVQDLTDSGDVESAPRSFQLPYDVELAEKIEKAMSDTENGDQLSGKFVSSDKDASDGKKLPDARGSDVSYFQDTPVVLQFEARAKPTLPKKTL